MSNEFHSKIQTMKTILWSNFNKPQINCKSRKQRKLPLENYINKHLHLKQLLGKREIKTQITEYLEKKDCEHLHIRTYEIHDNTNS